LHNLNWNRWLNNLLLLAGASLLLWAALVSVKPILASTQWEDPNYLSSSFEVNFPLPELSNTPDPPADDFENTIAMTDLPDPPPDEIENSIPGSESQDPTPSSLLVANIQPSEIITHETFLPLAYMEIAPTPTPTPTPVPSAGPVVRVVIPSINVDRAVVPLQQYVDSSGKIQYDTDSLFSNNNRLDLVGQMATSVNPGDGSNIVLVGHNYNQGWNGWGGVFLNIKNLQRGDKIYLYTENGDKYQYKVKKVEEVPLVYMDASELEKHLGYLGPSPKEQVTLMTCGGANFSIWSARIYVIAK
jgi:LPXTG-site transpeptidase (sortase) family protein